MEYGIWTMGKSIYLAAPPVYTVMTYGYYV